ncbi:pac11p [Saccharomyces arboricola H-6]|uniref:Pac11p n=1 Tax=Saccharomyces arboricola (strain H-6 / AS 2.3317 / CBS 10644) TaxID=1160507 RepID=J8PXW3_SACAR|nr:pac11p [Saccharomyces arboricola H-6]
MERLKELEEKRRQLKELRERRKQASLLTSSDAMPASITPYGQQAAATTTMVSVSVQTEMEEDLKTREPGSEPDFVLHRSKKVITYDKGIQTDQIEPELQRQDESASDDDNDNSTATATDIDAAVVKEDNTELEDADAQPRLELAKPVLIEGAAATLNDASFARLETIGPASGERALSDRHQERDGPMQWTMVSENIPSASECERIAQEYDAAKGILVVVYVRLPPADRQYASDEAAWSAVNVVKCDGADGRGGQLVDVVEFRGTRIMTATILRRDHSESQVVSILLTTFTGKTVLYELRLKQKREVPAVYVVQRNMIARHYFQHPVVAVVETSCVQGQERVMVAANDGSMAELSCLDLAVLRRPQRLRPVPLSQLLSLEDDSCAYTQRLTRLAKFEEVGVTSMAYTREEPQYVWVGAEDGGIYKVEWDQSGPLCLALDNNGFQSKESHSSRVTGLEFYGSGARRLMLLLLSCSTDWTVRLWDAQAGETAAARPLLLRAPVLRARWLGRGDDDDGRTLRCEVWCADGQRVVAEWVFDPDTSLYTATLIS